LGWPFFWLNLKGNNMLEVRNIVGIHISDPKLPGRMYLTDDATLTADPKKAKLIDDSKLHKALREIKAFSNNFFVTEVVKE
jgi:hypothetical protein